MNKKEIATYMAVFTVIQFLVGCGVFVTFPQMAAYAVSKDTMAVVIDKLNTIDANVNILLKERR